MSHPAFFVQADVVKSNQHDRPGYSAITLCTTPPAAVRQKNQVNRGNFPGVGYGQLGASERDQEHNLSSPEHGNPRKVSHAVNLNASAPFAFRYTWTRYAAVRTSMCRPQLKGAG